MIQLMQVDKESLSNCWHNVWFLCGESNEFLIHPENVFLSRGTYLISHSEFMDKILTVVVKVYSYSINFLKLIIVIEKSQVKKMDTCNFQ